MSFWLSHLVFPRIRAGASLKRVPHHDGRLVQLVFPSIRAGASLKHPDRDAQAVAEIEFSPAFVRGPH